MELLGFIPLYVVIVTMVMADMRILPEPETHRSRGRVKPSGVTHREGRSLCGKLAREPYFGVEMLLGRSWRIYYSWSMDLHDQCMDMTFWNVTSEIIDRIYNDMSEYLETEPYWDAATVLVGMGPARHEMLLFADQGSAGRFQGVPNVVRDGGLSPSKASVPLLNFQLKIIYGGKYLLMADCRTGVTTLSAHRKYAPNRAEIGCVVKTLDFGRGIQACLSDSKNYRKY